MEKPTKELVEEFISFKYAIHEDGSVSVLGSVYFTYKNLVKLPFRFRSVTGDFDCSGNNLTSLEGLQRVLVGILIALITS